MWSLRHHVCSAIIRKRNFTYYHGAAGTLHDYYKSGVAWLLRNVCVKLPPLRGRGRGTRLDKKLPG